MSIQANSERYYQNREEFGSSKITLKYKNEMPASKIIATMMNQLIKEKSDNEDIVETTTEYVSKVYITTLTVIATIYSSRKLKHCSLLNLQIMELVQLALQLYVDSD